jgi:hypothetical protein
MDNSEDNAIESEDGQIERWMKYVGYFVMVLLVLVLMGIVRERDQEISNMHEEIKILQQRTKFIDKDYTLSEITAVKK